MDYDGPVTILLPDGTEVQVTASLRTEHHGHLKGWSGDITSDDFAKLTEVHGAAGRELVTIRLPEGGEGTALVTNMHASMGGGAPASARLEITGSGPAPF